MGVRKASRAGWEKFSVVTSNLSAGLHVPVCGPLHL
jgi:hypothetical protein